MPQHHYLPGLDPEAANVPMPNRASHWQAEPAGFLKAVAKGIAVDGQAQTRGVSAVPDVWARPLLFQTALQPASGHPLHGQTVAEWRGLLSLLALREAYGYPVEIVPVDLSAGGALADALTTLDPGAVPLEAGTPYEWSDVLMIRYDGEPIGAFSPSTLVYTATGYQERLKGKRLDLCDDAGALRAPTKESDPHTAHYVAEWVYGLYEALRPILSDAPEAQVIGGLLQNWLSELRASYGYSPNAPINAPNVVWSGSVPTRNSAAHWPRLQTYAVYRHALTPLAEDDAGRLADRSTLFLQAGRNHTSVEGVVVIHEQTLTDDAQIWGLRRRRSLGDSVQDVLRDHFAAPSGTHIADRNLSKDNAAWIRPERFFLSDVLLAPQPGEGNHVLAHGEWRGNGTSARSGQAKGEYVLPFQRAVLDFFSPEDVEQTLKPTFEDMSDGSVRFSFSLPIGPLVAPGGAPAPQPPGPFSPAPSPSPFPTDAPTQAKTETIRVERIYRTKREGDPADGDGAIVRTTLPVLDLFPNYLGPAWRRYYLFQSDADTVTATPYAHGAEVEVRDREDDEDGVRRKVRVLEVHGDDPFPDGVVLQATDGLPLGVILVERPQWDVSGLAGEWTVGIDFGTSNTNVYRQEGASPAQDWTVDFPAHLRPLTADPQRRRDGLLETFFVPNREVRFPVPTLLDVLHPNPVQGRLLLDYFAHFPAMYRWPSRVRHNIKWDSDGRRVTEFYLESLLSLVLLETTRQNVQQITLRCSYPKSFSSNEVTVLKGEWEKTLQTLVDVPPQPAPSSERVLGTVPNLTPRIVPPTFYSEGLSAGNYFSNRLTILDATQRAEPARSICVDVGGGTTDLALWFDGSIVHDASVRMAGGQIARYIKERPRLQELLFGDEAQAALGEVRNDADLFGARFNRVLRGEDDKLKTRLIRNANTPEVRQLRQLIALKFGALAFHVGHVLAASDAWRQAEGLGAQIAQGGISVHWGGNAAKLATWIDYGKYDPSGLASNLLNALLYNSLQDAGVEANPSLLLQAQSPSHKAEAAAGLTVLVGDGGGGGPAPAWATIKTGSGAGGDGAPALSGTVCGENITLSDGTPNGTPIDYLDPISVDDLFDGRRHRVQEVSGDRLGRFIDLFNTLGTALDLHTAEMLLPADDNFRRQVTAKAQGLYVRMQDEPDGKRYVEPVFITEARELMDLVTSMRG